MKQEVLDKLHNTLIEIMDEIDRVCKDAGITYYLTGGTLLGAIRHQGFIPWDDDMDIMIPRADYEKFCSIFSSVASSKFYLLSNEIDAHYWKSHAKICKRGTVYLENAERSQNIFVDVFPLDEANEKNSLFQKLRFSLIKACDRIVCFRLYKGYNPGQAKILCYLTIAFPINWIRVFQKRLMMLKKHKYDCYFVYEISGVYGSDRSLWPKLDFGQKEFAQFEGREYIIPSGYDRILSITYHDYMQLPPVEKRRTHNPIRLSFDVNGPDEILD